MVLNKNKKQVVVLIIAYQEVISNYEKVSLRQCLTRLGRYPVAIVKPESLDVSGWPEIEASVCIETFPDYYFKNIGAYSRLLLSPKFYRRFRQYEYMLIYQLDAFVFGDELSVWCDKGLHYIGAPWFENFAFDDENASILKSGNGGFSLRNVKAHLKVLHSFSYLSRPKDNWTARMKDKPTGRKWLTQLGGFLLDLCIRNNTFWMLNSFMGYEDQFWGLVAAKNFRWFKIADTREAMDFSFEMQPRRLYQLNNNKLPFGCHAWWKYDLEFWKPYIEKFGHKL